MRFAQLDTLPHGPGLQETPQALPAPFQRLRAPHQDSLCLPLAHSQRREIGSIVGRRNSRLPSTAALSTDGVADARQRRAYSGVALLASIVLQLCSHRDCGSQATISPFLCLSRG